MSSKGDSVELKLNRVKIESNSLELKSMESIIEFFGRHRIRELDAAIFEKKLNLKPFCSTLEEVTLDFESEYALS